MKSNSLVAFALSLTFTLAVPPENFGFPASQDDTPLSMVYTAASTSQPVSPGQLFGIEWPAQAPSIAVNETYNSLDNDYNGQYLLLMVDPDASYPENPQNRFIIHWWQENLMKSMTEVNAASIGGTRLVNSTQPRVSYRRPRPPTNSSAHRYIAYLFEQPASWQVPEMYSGYNNTNATRFPLQSFLNDVNLDDPVAANYFYCSNQTAVPGTFVAAPNETYPGGNGAMITQGTNEPSSTGSSPSATGSATGTGSAPAPTFSFDGGANAVTAGKGALGMALVVGASWLML